MASARRSRVEWENRQRKKQGLDTLAMDELIAKAWRFVRERFRSYQTELKSRGIKRPCASRCGQAASGYRHPGETAADA